MMNRIQKVLLICSIICFGLTLYAFLFQDFWVLLVCFILHSISLLAFSYFCFRTQEERTPESVVLKEELEQTKADMRSVRDDLETRSQEADAELRQSREKLEEANKQIARLEQALKEARDSTDKEASRQALTSILPELVKPRPANATVDIVDVARETANEFHDAAAQAGLTVKVTSQGQNLLVKADPSMLRTLFRNIIDNSIKYMKRHGSLVITLSNIGDELFIVLKDTGEGLSEEETRHIFELNYQGSNRISGNGLGLYQAKAIVEYYGGTIYAKSTPGKGMGIFVELPTT